MPTIRLKSILAMSLLMAGTGLSNLCQAAETDDLFYIVKPETKRQLDPFKEEITLTRYEDGNWQANISIDGWIKLLNQDQQFNGVVFKESGNLIDGVPEWIECSIFRKDRDLPIVVKEYLVEVKSEQPIWQKMSRRILRHRALQQCARFYF